METITQLLNEIEKSLQQLDHPCVDHLNPGISSQKIQELFEKIPLQPTQDLHALYAWRNGSKDCEGITLGELAFFPGFYLMSLEESIQTYLELKETDDWEKSWFPIFASGGGDFYAMILAPEAQGKILGFYVFEEEAQVEYLSLKSMLATLKTCYEQGIIFRNEQGYLDMDYRKHAEVAHEINPDVKELIEEVENNLELATYIGLVPKKNKKTQASYLESLNHLAYLLYLDGQEEMAKELLDRIIQVPFEGNYNTWTFVDSALVLLAYLEREKENQVLVYKKLLLSPLEQGEESTQNIRRRVHQRFLNGDSLEQKLAKIEQASSPESEMERRLLYLTDLLKIHLFIVESTCEETDIQAKIEENMEILKKYIKEYEIYSLFPFKG